MKKVKLTQQPYIDKILREERWRHVYRAAAEDSEGNIYDVCWTITNRHADEESDACDWEEYYAYNEYGHLVLVEVE